MQEPLTLPPRGPSHGVANGQTPMVLPGSKSPAKVQSGFPRNLGDPAVSIGTQVGMGWPNRNSPGPRTGRSSSRGSESAERSDGTAKRRKTKRGGMGGGKSQRPDSTDEAREPRHTGGPRGGKRASDHETS